ncbi:MAG TPA: NAD(P)H-dependent glycerol-3-phosphate dehydrogenase, partial [Victivallales bacterium]|nr:NAD(P)H-dependent glycerol-3-phosphate dehydrogenase [Victivallales bacterium]
MKISVLGDGAWGTVMALLLNGNGHSLSLWGYFSENIREIRKTGENGKFLPGVKIPQQIKLCEDLSEALTDSELVVLAVPSQFSRGILKTIGTAKLAGKIIVNLAKGIENESLKRMSEVFFDEIGESPKYCVLSGPSHAEEVAVGQPTAVVVASKSNSSSEIVQKTFMNKNLRVYTSKDMIGVELGGALKNIFAIAAGISDGMKLGDNPKAALLTRGIAE